MKITNVESQVMEKTYSEFIFIENYGQELSIKVLLGIDYKTGRITINKETSNGFIFNSRLNTDDSIDKFQAECSCIQRALNFARNEIKSV